MNKKLMMFGLLGIFSVMLVTAGLVNYLSNTETASADIQSPITLNGDNFQVAVDYAGEDAFALIEITNNLDYEIQGDVDIAISPDIEGISIAVTDDINYCFKEQGDMTGVTDCKTDYLTWMENNIDWSDWYANEAYDEEVFRSNLVINHGDNSFFPVGYTGNNLILPGMDFPSETVYGIVYVATDIALEPNTYDFDITIRPTA